MEKNLKSCSGDLFRGDLTGHGHFIRLGRKSLDGHALLIQSSKGHPCRILILFPLCSTALLTKHIKSISVWNLYYTSFKNENEWQKTEPVPIPLPGASRNVPNVKTRNNFFFYNCTSEIIPFIHFGKQMDGT